MIRNFIFLYFLFSSSYLYSQVYKEEGHNRYTFAQTTIGYDLDFTPSAGSSYFLNDQGELEKFYFRNKVTPVITITGLHFWGHAEFFTGFSLLNFHFGKASADYLFTRSAGTGAKYFPWAITSGGFRPYIGMSIAGFKYKQGEAAVLGRVEYPLLLGLTYSFKRGMFELGCMYYYSNDYNYYISRNEQVTLSTPPLSINVDFKYYIDFSMASYRKDLNGENKRILESLTKRKRLSSIFIAAGPAYAFIIGNSNYNRDQRPYLDDYKITSIFPDFGLGYYNYKWDAAVNLSSRFYTASLSGNGVKQTIKRTSFGLEMYKFFGDYHGFVPFIGPVFSLENLSAVEEENNVEVFRASRSFVSAGIIAGWDIRPTRTDWWGVRTNIRYYPQLSLGVKDGLSLDLQQIELNFLQLIIYPNRFNPHGK
ncbi:MAG: hypothetical protein H7282_05325 [Cytophagaceae bacterium]|nr:hypothetical protein [Cytophagaceae bacterium]